jgi:hypothetical protein
LAEDIERRGSFGLGVVMPSVHCHRHPPLKEHLVFLSLFFLPVAFQVLFVEVFKVWADFGGSRQFLTSIIAGRYRCAKT